MHYMEMLNKNATNVAMILEKTLNRRPHNVVLNSVHSEKACKFQVQVLRHLLQGRHLLGYSRIPTQILTRMTTIHIIFGLKFAMLHLNQTNFISIYQTISKIKSLYLTGHGELILVVRDPIVMLLTRLFNGRIYQG